MLNFWDERYAREDYVYGREPNEWFRECLDRLTPGTLLLPAEGEGRNAVYAARSGWAVEAFDLSPAGRAKAEQLAMEAGVNFNYRVMDAAEVDWPMASLDAIGLVFTHFPSAFRRSRFPVWMSWLKPGGHLIAEVFSQGQLAYQQSHDSGGPREADLLYSLDTIREEFPGMEFQVLEERTVELEEGAFHVGPALVIRMLGRKA